ncbi:hypothetical protein ACSLMH_06200 [Flavobacterium columnare]|uniref:hypothetical protein n=1 Tax=Flavobacterium columnare TaxID=996 RepID=UPI001896731A|nr:hypothetical protein [Flavobacterium columnare]MBF6657388.1 hypothetical protein [Flavobacterium columnare]
MKKWIIKTNDGWIRLIDVLITYKNSETFENIKKRIYKCLIKDNRYSNYDKKEIKKLITSTERNKDDYYIWDVGGKEYRVELVNESIAEHTTTVLQDGY